MKRSNFFLFLIIFLTACGTANNTQKDQHYVSMAVTASDNVNFTINGITYPLRANAIEEVPYLLANTTYPITVSSNSTYSFVNQCSTNQSLCTLKLDYIGNLSVIHTSEKSFYIVKTGDIKDPRNILLYTNSTGNVISLNTALNTVDIKNLNGDNLYINESGYLQTLNGAISNKETKTGYWCITYKGFYYKGVNAIEINVPKDNINQFDHCYLLNDNQITLNYDGEGSFNISTFTE